jgi:hypothetical protein
MSRRPAPSPPARPTPPAAPAPMPPAMPQQVVTLYVWGLLGLAIVNGIFSPFRTFVFLFHGVWYPAILPVSLPFVLMFSSLLTATLMLMVAGVPAALYERFSGKGRTDQVSLWIWVSALALLSLPSIPAALGALR